MNTMQQWVLLQPTAQQKQNAIVPQAAGLLAPDAFYEMNYRIVAVRRPMPAPAAARLCNRPPLGSSPPW